MISKNIKFRDKLVVLVTKIVMKNCGYDMMFDVEIIEQFNFSSGNDFLNLQTKTHTYFFVSRYCRALFNVLCGLKIKHKQKMNFCAGLLTNFNDEGKYISHFLICFTREIKH